MFIAVNTIFFTILKVLNSTNQPACFNNRFLGLHILIFILIFAAKVCERLCRNQNFAAVSCFSLTSYPNRNKEI